MNLWATHMLWEHLTGPWSPLSCELEEQCELAEEGFERFRDGSEWKPARELQVRVMMRAPTN